MKVKVIRPFLDKFNLARTFNPGEVADFEEDRAKDIVERGLGEFIVEKKPEAKSPSAEPKAPRKPRKKKAE